MKKKKILIFGGTGSLGSNLVYIFQDRYDLYLNFHKKKIFSNKIKYVKIFNNSTINLRDIKKKIEDISPYAIINCVANTDLDYCEANPEKTKFPNSILPNILSKIAYKKSIKFIHFSTDHLWSKNESFKSEKEKTSPINNYAKQKVLAEKQIKLNNKNALIIRTNFFSHSINDDKSINIIINSIKKRLPLKLDDRYYFTPIYSFILIKILNKLIIKNIKGIFNIVSNEKISKYKFGILISEFLKIKKPNIIKESIDNAYLKAKRCKDLSLSNAKIKNILNIKIPSIEKQLEMFFKNESAIKKKLLFTIKYGQHSVNNADILSVKKILQDGPLTQGQFIKETEVKIANYVGAKYAVAVSSATAGLHLSYMALGISEKKKIITSPITFISTSNAALYCNSRPLFSDIDLKTINLCPSKLETNLKKNKNIYCITPVHFSGLASNMKEINYLAKKYKLKIVEDAAHALGARYECGSMVGSGKYSDLCVFSFHPVKIIAGGEGGIITTNSEELYQTLIKLRTHGINQNSKQLLNKSVAYTKNEKNLWYYEMTDLGYHYRQTDIHCGLIYSQMDRIDQFLSKRKKIAEIYDEHFNKNNKFYLPQYYQRNFSSNHLYTLNFNFKKENISRNRLMDELQKRNIFTQVHYIPVPLQYYYKKMGYNMKNLKNALLHYNQCISLPIYYDLTKDQQQFVIDSVEEILQINK